MFVTNLTIPGNKLPIFTSSYTFRSIERTGRQLPVDILGYWEFIYRLTVKLEKFCQIIAKHILQSRHIYMQLGGGIILAWSWFLIDPFTWSFWMWINIDSVISQSKFWFNLYSGSWITKIIFPLSWCINILNQFIYLSIHVKSFSNTHLNLNDFSFKTF